MTQPIQVDILNPNYKMCSVGNAPVCTCVSPRLGASLTDDGNGDDYG